MKVLALGFALLSSLPWSASAESLRCEGGSVSEGDSRLSLVYKCGEPQLKDMACSPVYYPGTLEVMPEEYASRLVPCLPVETWFYQRGPGELTATVYLRSGRVQSISYGRVPR